MKKTETERQKPDISHFIAFLHELRPYLKVLGTSVLLSLVLYLASSCNTRSVEAEQSTYLPSIVTLNTVGTTPFPTESATTAPVETATPTNDSTITPTPSVTPTATETITASPTPTVTAIETPTPVSTTEASEWKIKSISSMKLTKDLICNQPPTELVQEWVEKIADLGVTHIGVETPYDNPHCGDSVMYTQLWLDTVRAKNLSIWHRHMPLAFEGIYDTAKDTDFDYAELISQYIIDHPDFFKAGDVFTLIPEPQNSGIWGANCGDQSSCMFDSVESFNDFLLDASNRAKLAFKQIGFKFREDGNDTDEIIFACCGFDGYITWGDNNPDHLGRTFLDPEVIRQIGVLTIDHYPQNGATMAEDLAEMRNLWPAEEYPLLIGEWGPIYSGPETVEADTTQTMTELQQAANVIGMQYWHGGLGGNESLLETDAQDNLIYAPQADEVKAQFETIK